MNEVTLLEWLNQHQIVEFDGKRWYKIKDCENEYLRRLKKFFSTEWLYDCERQINYIRVFTVEFDGPEFLPRAEEISTFECKENNVKMVEVIVFGNGRTWTHYFNYYPSLEALKKRAPEKVFYEILKAAKPSLFIHGKNSIKQVVVYGDCIIGTVEMTKISPSTLSSEEYLYPVEQVETS